VLSFLWLFFHSPPPFSALSFALLSLFSHFCFHFWLFDPHLWLFGGYLWLLDEIFGFSGVIYGFLAKERILSYKSMPSDHTNYSSNSSNTNKIKELHPLALLFWHIPCLKNGIDGSTNFRNE